MRRPQCAATFSSSTPKERTERHPRERHQELPMHTISSTSTKKAAAIRGDKDAIFGVVLARDCRGWVSLQLWTAAASQRSSAVDLDAVAWSARVVPCGGPFMQDPIAVLKVSRHALGFSRDADGRPEGQQALIKFASVFDRIIYTQQSRSL